LLAVENRSPSQEAFLTVLATLVERWESDHVRFPSLTGVELVKELLATSGLRQKDLVPVFGSESIVSEVLSGRRELRSKHIAGLADFFHVSPAVFFETRVPALT